LGNLAGFTGKPVCNGLAYCVIKAEGSPPSPAGILRQIRHRVRISGRKTRHHSPGTGWRFEPVCGNRVQPTGKPGHCAGYPPPLIPPQRFPLPEAPIPIVVLLLYPANRFHQLRIGFLPPSRSLLLRPFVIRATTDPKNSCPSPGWCILSDVPS
jgi:hypothetical protein